MFRVWLLFALPWLAGVVAISIRDHHRAIERAVELHFADPTASSMQTALQWLLAAVRYSGDSIFFHGILPVSLTFVLYVMFLPWADRWSRQGLLED